MKAQFTIKDAQPVKERKEILDAQPESEFSENNKEKLDDSKSNHSKNNNESDTKQDQDEKETEDYQFIDTQSGEDNALINKKKTMIEMKNDIDKNDGIVSNLLLSMVTDQIKKTERTVFLNDNRSLLLYINSWPEINSARNKSSITIIDKIPSLIKLNGIHQSLGHNMMNGDLITNTFSFAKTANSNPFIKSSQDLFRPGTVEAYMTLESKNLPTSIKFEYDKITDTEIDLPSYSFSPDSLEDNKGRKDVLLSILNTAYKLIRACDVLIQDVEVVTFNAVKVGVFALDTLNDAVMILDMPPHVAFSTVDHPLNWYVREVNDIMFSDDTRPLFNVTRTNVRETVDKTVISYYYNTTTDAVFATLHHLFEGHRNANLLLPTMIPLQLASLVPINGVTIRPFFENSDRYYNIMDLTATMLDQFMFAMMISEGRRKRLFSFSKMEMEKFGAIYSVDPSTIARRISNTSGTALLNPDLLQTAIQSRCLTNNIDSLYDMFLISMFPEYFEISNVRTVAYDPLTSLVELISIGLDALLFPGAFWSNVDRYTYSLYKAFSILLPREYTKMMNDIGFTDADHNLREINKADLRNGYIPKVFERKSRNNLPKLIKNYMNCLAVYGKFMPFKSANYSKNVHYQLNMKYYLPWEFKPLKLGGKGEMPFMTRAHGLLDCISDIARSYRTNVDTLRNQDLSQYNYAIASLKSVIEVISYMVHFEFPLIFATGIDKPYTFTSGFNGIAEPFIPLRFGITSTTKLTDGARIMEQTRVNMPYDIGLWILFCLRNDDIDINGKYVQRKEHNMTIPNPTDVFDFYRTEVKSTVSLADCFGILNLIDSEILTNDPDFSFLLNMYGRHLRAGTARSWVESLLTNADDVLRYRPEGIEPDFIVDIRMNNPRLCTINAYDEPTAVDDERYHVMKRALTLVDPVDVKKFSIGIKVLASTNSPFHAIRKGLTFANQTFRTYDFDNMHETINHTVIDYDLQLFKVATINGVNRVIFTYEDNDFSSHTDPGFPHDILLVILRQKQIPSDIMAFLITAVDYAGWVLSFPEQIFIARAYALDHITVTRSVISKVNDESALLSSDIGQIIEIPFISTKAYQPNNVTVVLPGSVTQKICPIKPIQYNSVCKAINGVIKPVGFEAPVKDMWILGRPDPTIIPSFVNGQRKIDSQPANFNNALKVYTSKAILEKFPKPDIITPTTLDIMNML